MRLRPTARQGFSLALAACYLPVLFFTFRISNLAQLAERLQIDAMTRGPRRPILPDSRE
jgi:hypothetical protein